MNTAGRAPALQTYRYVLRRFIMKMCIRTAVPLLSAGILICLTAAADPVYQGSYQYALESSGTGAGAYYQQTDGIKMKRFYREDLNHVPGDGSYYDRHPEAGGRRGYNNGYQNGYQNGYSNGYQNGYQNGNQQRFYYGNTNRYYGDGSFYDYNVRGGNGALADSDYLELAIKTKKSSYCDKISDKTLKANCIDSVMRIGGW